MLDEKEALRIVSYKKQKDQGKRKKEQTRLREQPC